MAGRTGEALLTQVERWHRQLSKETTKKKLSWEHHFIPDFEYITGTAKKNNVKRWEIRQLITQHELSVEADP